MYPGAYATLETDNKYRSSGRNGTGIFFNRCDGARRAPTERNRELSD